MVGVEQSIVAGQMKINQPPLFRQACSEVRSRVGRQDVVNGAVHAALRDKRLQLAKGLPRVGIVSEDEAGRHRHPVSLHIGDGLPVTRDADAQVCRLARLRKRLLLHRLDADQDKETAGSMQPFEQLVVGPDLQRGLNGEPLLQPALDHPLAQGNGPAAVDRQVVIYEKDVARGNLGQLVQDLADWARLVAALVGLPDRAELAAIGTTLRGQHRVEVGPVRVQVATWQRQPVQRWGAAIIHLPQAAPCGVVENLWPGPLRLAHIGHVGVAHHLIR